MSNQKVSDFFFQFTDMLSDMCSMKQDPDVENAFYISWVEEESDDPRA